MVNAAEKAARTLKRDFGEIEQLQVSQKGTSDFVTLADTRTERILQKELSKARPGYNFLMEESGYIAGTDSNRTWIIDPIDGTTNFIHGIPHFSISIALKEYEELVAALVYNPALDELYLAQKGQGATCNNHRLRVSGRKYLSESVIATGIPHNGRGNHTKYIAELSRVMSSCSGIRRFGSASLDLAYVAAGRVDGFWETGLQSWDVAAGILLVKEAGGFVSEINGKKNELSGDSILAGNPDIHKSLCNLLNKGT